MTGRLVVTPKRAKQNSDGNAGTANGDRASRQSLIAEWEKLCARYLPFKSKGSIWRFSRRLASTDPEQGWKLHVSATVLSANQVLKQIGSFLREQDILFKAPRSLEELRNLNCGVYYGFSQIGKFITIYPSNPKHALLLARKLHQLTAKLHGPRVPFDLQFRKKSAVFYRYGGFSEIEIESEDGKRTLAIRDEKGALIPDLRSPEGTAPDWVANPFLSRTKVRRKIRTSPLQNRIRAFEALSQRGKGGVYRAVDLSTSPVRLCVLKEGRRHGETDWDRRDGYWRIKHEEHVLGHLTSAGIAVPNVYDSFTVDSHYYLVTEYIEGVNLQSLLLDRRKSLSLSQVIQYALQASELLYEIHSAGWVWRDCKPLNFIVARENQLRPIDFEGACLITQPDPTAWGTYGYAAPDALDERVPKSREPEDLFALGAMLYQLLSREIPVSRPRASSVKKLDRHVPIALKKLISALLHSNPRHRPRANIASALLKAALLSVG